MLDLINKNGIYPNFEANKMERKNIGIKDGKISYIGDELPEALKTIDAEGQVVSPGFIDIHMHEENFLKEGKEYVIAQMMLEMGVTTVSAGKSFQIYH